MKNTDSQPTTAEYAAIAEMQIEIGKISAEKRKEYAEFATAFKFCEPFKANQALTRKERKKVLEDLKKHNDKEAKELFDDDEEETLASVLKQKATLKDDLSDDQKEVVFDSIAKLREIKEPSDVTLSEIFTFVGLVIGRTYEPELFEGK